MSNTSVNAVMLIPLTITGAMIAAGTSVPEVDAATGEVAWAAGTAYAVLQRVNDGGWLWDAVAASTGVKPGTDPTKWLRAGPSNRMAAFDDELNTKATAMGALTYVLHPGFFTGIDLRGMVGDQLEIQIYDAPGGVLMDWYESDLYEQALGLYELLFMPLRQRTQHYMRNLPLYPNAEVRITITSEAGAAVEVAAIAIGHWDTLIGTGDVGGVEYGANAAVKSYSYRKVNDDGTVQRLRRGSATNVTCSVAIETDQANYAMDLLRQCQGRSVVVIASGLPRYDFLSTVGDVSGDITVDRYSISRINLKIEGNVQ